MGNILTTATTSTTTATPTLILLVHLWIEKQQRQRERQRGRSQRGQSQIQVARSRETQLLLPQFELLNGYFARVVEAEGVALGGIGEVGGGGQDPRQRGISTTPLIVQVIIADR